MTVKLVYRGKEYEVHEGMTVRDALKKIGLQPETTLAVQDGKLMTDDTILKEGMKIKLVAVISGGCPLLCREATGDPFRFAPGGLRTSRGGGQP